MANHVYEDEWGAVINRPGYIEIRWYDSTADFDEEAFNAWLLAFAGMVAELQPAGALVDGTSFLMGPEHMNMEWRDANIVPIYNEAGLQKFAFHMPAGMPLIGSDPVKEGPAEYATGYFGTRADAVAWLTG